MTRNSSIDSVFYPFLALALIGWIEFIAANAIGITAAVWVGAFLLIIWIGAGVRSICFSSVWKSSPPWARNLFLIVSAWTLWLSLMPPYFGDDLILNLELPKYALSHGEWAGPAFQPAGKEPNLIRPIYLIFVYFGIDSLASFIPALFFLASLAVCALWLSSAFVAPLSLAGVVSFALLPVFFRLSTAAYGEPAVIFFSLCGLIYLKKYVERSDPFEAVKGLVALSAGSAIICNAVFFMAAALAGLFLASINRKPTADFFRLTAVSVLAVLIFCGPWWVKGTFETTSNPTANIELESSKPALPEMDKAARGNKTNASAFFAPIGVFFNGSEGMERGFDGKLNPFFVVFAFGALIIFRSRGHLFIGAAVFLYIFLTPLRFPTTALVLLPAVPGLLFLSLAFLASMKERRGAILPYSLAALMAIYSLPELFKSADRFNGWRYLTGGETRDEFLTRYLPSQKAVKFANKNFTGGEKVYMAFLGKQVYYLNAEYFYDNSMSDALLTDTLMKKSLNEDILKAFKTQGITHILLHKPIAGRFLGEKGLYDKFIDFRKTASSPVYEDRLIALIKLN